ncbi:twin transmembrane helix small protein [Pseudahrensia aquimaris]|uniref:Twin transmembrane helix small protein n=1 Tax=Pseudahrensia aquimaris TaxID=744461 RepID=A0ABW3FDQ0_9HYPH
MNWSYIFLMVACFIVGLVLLRGLFNMMQGGSSNKSQQLMRLRVIAQAIAVAAMVLVVWLSRE